MATGEKRKADALIKCPYLDTINRQILDFDFEKVCSVSCENLNVYACLVCGQYFKGRGLGTQAYFHSLQEDHHCFINLDTAKVYCLPDNYQVVDPSLQDIQRMLIPTFNPLHIARLDNTATLSRGVDGSEYLPGVIGLNNIKCTDYVNVIVNMLCRVPPLRDFFLNPSNYARFAAKSPVVDNFASLIRKIWSPYNFKGQVSPHEFLQAVIKASDKKFQIGAHSDAMEFMSWLLNTLHRDLGGTKRPGSSIIHRVFQGQVQMTRLIPKHTPKEGDDLRRVPMDMTSTVVPFLYLTVDVPAAPVFKDELDRNIIPQIPLLTLMHKFDGQYFQDMVNGERRQHKCNSLPNYVILHIKRFTKNTQLSIEKNPTIVNFPVKNLDFAHFINAKLETGDEYKYNLVSSILHEGPANAGAYKIHIHHAANDQWYDLQDLHVTAIHPQLISVSEAYIQIYQRKTVAQTRTAVKTEAGEEAVKTEGGEAVVKEEQMEV